jgi:lycopene beta-cyclase
LKDVQTTMTRHIALVGAGLHNLLLARLLVDSLNLRQNPSLSKKLRLTLVESSPTLETAKCLSCHDLDVPLAWRPILKSLWLKRWPSYHVRFPRPGQGASAVNTPFMSVPLGYRTLDLASLAQSVLQDAQDGLLDLRTNTAWNDSLACQSGYDIIVDSRTQHPNGEGASRPKPPAGVQQFLGRVYRLDQEHRVVKPVVMDAEVKQEGGFSFVYLLPLTPQTILVEATRLLAEHQPWSCFERALEDYLTHRNWHAHVVGIDHKEQGLIPIPLVTARQWSPALAMQARRAHGAKGHPRVFKVGAAHGFFHPTTGYSLPIALRSCLALEQVVRSTLTKPQDAPALGVSEHSFADFAKEQKQFWRAALLFNRFLLWGFRGEESWNAFRYFYALPRWFVRLFYSGQIRVVHWTLLLGRLPPHRFRLVSLLRTWLRMVRSGGSPKLSS